MTPIHIPYNTTLQDLMDVNEDLFYAVELAASDIWDKIADACNSLHDPSVANAYWTLLGRE